MKRKTLISRVESTLCRTNSGRREESPERSGSESSLSASDMSVDGSCVSSDAEETTTPREAAPMMLVGCPRCLMYVMLSEANPKCPRCQSTVLLDFLADQNSDDDNTD